MPKPIICLSAALRQFAEAFRDLFTQPQWKYFVTVLLALSECQERRTLSALRRCTAESLSLAGLSRFLAHAPWSAQAVAARWQQRFRERLTVLVQAEHQRQRLTRLPRRGCPPATVVTGHLVLDDSPQVKVKGRHMQGLGHHHVTGEARRLSGHSLFTGLYLLLGQSCPLPPQMYRQQVTCEQEGVAFASKVDMAVQAVETFEPVPGTETEVLVDSWYFCQRLYRTARRRGFHLSGGLKRNRCLRVMQPDGSRRWRKLSEYAATLTPADFEPVFWPSDQGGRPVYAHRLRTRVRKLGAVQVVITCEALTAPLSQWRFWATTRLEADTQAVIHTLALRWAIETWFADGKEELGLDHYQVMTVQAILRFWTLAACLTCFLDEQRALTQEATRGEMRRIVQVEHQGNLLSWITEQLQAGLLPIEVKACLRIADPKVQT